MPKYDLGQVVFRMYNDDVQEFTVSGIRTVNDGGIYYSENIGSWWSSLSSWVPEENLFQTRGHVIEHISRPR